MPAALGIWMTKGCVDDTDDDQLPLLLEDVEVNCRNNHFESQLRGAPNIPLTAPQHREVKGLFDSFDRGSGLLRSKEARKALMLLGVAATETELALRLGIDLGRYRSISFHEFLRLSQVLLSDPLLVEEENKMAFDFLVAQFSSAAVAGGTDSGMLESGALKQLLTTGSHPFDADEWESFLSAVDPLGTGLVQLDCLKQLYVRSLD